MVQDVLAHAAVDLTACDALAFGAGPGAFTGLRIACGVVQGLAYGAGKPVIAVGNLEALALAALRQDPQAQRVLCANDARMREAYVAVYEREGDRAAERLAPALLAARDLGGLIERWAPDVVAGDAPTTFADELALAAEVVRLVPMRATAASVAACAIHKWRAAGAVEPARAAPLYVRDHVALTIEERRVRRGSPA